MQIRVHSLFAGKIQRLEPEGQPTGIYKSAINDAQINQLGIVGDMQADRRHHGGSEKALHQYSLNAYSKLKLRYKNLAAHFTPGSMGENISAPLMNEENVHLGDEYRIGPVVLQVSQPRTPCWKINHKFSENSLSRYIEENQLNGWYYRVLESGKIKLGDRIEIINRYNDSLSIQQFLRITQQHRPKLTLLEQCINCRDLAPEWQQRLSRRLHYLKQL